MDIREEFEKLHEIAERLKNQTIKFVDSTNRYYCYHYSVEFLNGAWYAFQEQQKKIDAALNKIDALSWASESDVEEIKELLK